MRKTEDYISGYTVEDLAGQLFCPAAFIHDDEAGIARMEQLIRDHKIGGITFFHSRASAATNYEKKEVPVFKDSLQKLKDLIVRYQSLSEIPLLISIDAEWGLAMRVEKTPQYPYAITLGSLAENSEQLVFEAAKGIGSDLKSAGIDFNLAPVADINSNPENPVIGYRSFGASREKVLGFASQYCKGLSAAGVLNCLKHFPGHGDTAVDSHLGLPVIKRTKTELMENDLYPFKKLIDQGVDSVMVGHLAVPALSGDQVTPATLSSKIIKGLLRDTFGFKGVVISDALNMHSVSKIYPEKGMLEFKAFEAGNDMLCFTDHIAEGKEKILNQGDRNQLLESIGRVLELKEKAGILSPVSRPENPDFDRAKEINSAIAAKSIVHLGAGEHGPTEVNTLIVIGDHKKAKPFISKLNKSGTFTSIRISGDTASITLSEGQEVVIAVVPPNIKPIDHFGVSEPNMALLESLLSKHHCKLVLFGNPYFLNTIPFVEKAREIIISGQVFEEFQDTAAAILNGDQPAEGVMPFTFEVGS